MSSIIPSSTANIPPRSLALETAERNPIDNWQGNEISQFERNTFAVYDGKYGASAVRRAGPTPVYNCHGMTFAARRTCISQATAIQRIIADDRYHEVQASDVLPGDIILYLAEDGDIEHSGIVLTSPSTELLGVPRVCSKWGKYAEIIHLANNCPYNSALIKYYRVTR